MLIEDVNGRSIIRGYFSTIQHAINCLVDKKIRLSEADSITKLIEDIKTLRAELSKALTPLKLRVV